VGAKNDIKYALFNSYVDFAVIGGDVFAKTSHAPNQLSQLGEHGYLYIESGSDQLCVRCGLTYMQLTPELLEYWKSRMEASDRAKP
jgi:hypothetical protein